MTRRLPLVAVLLGALALVTAATQGLAQGAPSAPQGQPRSFLPSAQRAAPPAQASGPLQQAYAWLTAKQAEVNHRLAAAVREIRTGNPLMATLVLAALSFAYGVLHAAGPGHGKAVISSYVLANERTVRRGIALSFLAALIQGLSALVVVGVLVLVLKATGLTMRATEGWLETASWALVAIVGAWLLWGQIRQARQMHIVAPGADGHHTHGPDAHHQHTHAHGAHHDHHDHHHQCCDHAHMPDPRQLEAEWSWRKALALAFAVGVRPCTGAILVLVFAIGQGLLWAGVFATFAMAIGTAITVSALAALAVGSRELAARVGGANGAAANRVRLVAGVGGSALVLVLGVVFFLGSLNGTGAL
jgi:nickel/cobalt exporter